MTLGTSLMAIDYLHERNGVLYHATATSAGGEIRLSWTVAGHGEMHHCEGTTSIERFRELWNAVATAKVFAGYCVVGTGQPDPVAYHCITVVYHTDGEHGLRSMLVPTHERDPAFVDWVMSLGATYRPPAKPNGSAETGQNAVPDES